MMLKFCYSPLEVGAQGLSPPINSCYLGKSYILLKFLVIHNFLILLDVAPKMKPQGEEAIKIR